MAKPAFTMEQAHQLRKRYESGESTVELAKEFTVGDGCISSWIKRAGGKIRSISENKRKYYFNMSFWDIIDSEQKAYWLGFFLADGYIGQYNGKWRNLWCTLSAKDGDHLVKFLKDINASYHVHYNCRDGHEKAFICLTSIEFVENLINMGWLDFKRNGDTRILNTIPKELFHHFVRGFFDGDGSIGRQLRKDRKKLSYSYSITIVAPIKHYDFLDNIRIGICKETGAKDKRLKRGNSVWRCHWNGNKQIDKIGKWMYRDAHIFLERKRSRFDQINNPITFNWPDSNKFSCSVKPTDIMTLVDMERDKIIDEFCRLALKSKWKALQYNNDQLIADWRSIVIYNSSLYCTNDGFKLNTGGNQESPGKKIVLHYQPHFWNVKTSGPTIPSQWNNEKIIRRAAVALLTSGTKITLNRYLRELRYAGAGIASHFHPNFACAVIGKLAPNIKSWFDPCMGWGGRLMAAKVTNVDYEGCEPQPNTYNGLRDIKKFIKSDAILNHTKIQDYKFIRRFDLGFTSPPFFNKEKYGGSEQSYSEFTRFENWITEFLCPIIDKLLSNCDCVIIHVDKRMRDVLDKLYNFDSYSITLQRNPGSSLGTEFIIRFK